MIARMWEARVVPGGLAAAVEWLREDVVPRALATPECRGAEGFSAQGGEERVVLITRWESESAALSFDEHRSGGAAPEFVARAHAWTFGAID